MMEKWPFNNLFKSKNNIDVIDIDEELISDEELEVFDLDFQKQLKKNDFNITTKVDNFIKDKKEKIKSLDKRLKEILKTVKDLSSEELIPIEEELIAIKEEIFNIKKQYKILKQNEKIDKLDKKVVDEIGCFDYEFNQTDNDVIASFVMSCQNELKHLLDLINIDSKKKLKEEKKESAKYELSKKQIETNIKSQSQYINELNKKIKQFQDKDEQLYLYALKNMSKNCLLLALYYNSLFSNQNLLLGGINLNNLIRGMRNIMLDHKIIYLNYDKYESTFQKGQSELKGTSNLINDNINQIASLKREFEYNYWEYKDAVPTYSLIYRRLEFIEQQLYIKNSEISRKLAL